MKQKYTRLYIGLIMLFFATTIQAQILPGKGEFTPPGIENPGGGITLPGSGVEVPDFTFNPNNAFATALANEDLARRARDARKTEWFNKQKALIKKQIENKLNKNFANYDQAKDALFAHSEINNIRRNSIPPRDSYRYRKGQGFGKQRKHVEGLKLLKLREAEIKAGNINNSQYGLLKVDGVYLKDMKSQLTLDRKWASLSHVFAKNTAETHINNYIFLKLDGINGDQGMKALAIRLKNDYYNGFDDFDKVSLMQVLLHYEWFKDLSKCTVCVMPTSLLKFLGLDRATSPIIEDYAKKNRSGGVSIFDDAYINIISQNYVSLYPNDPREALDHAERVVAEEREAVIKKLIDAKNALDLAIENLAVELNLTNNQVTWLNSDSNREYAKKVLKLANENRVNNNIKVNIANFIREAIVALMNGMEVDFDDKIIVGLKGKLKCLHDKLTKNGNTFVKDLLKNFEGDGSEFSIKILSEKKVFSQKSKKYVNGVCYPPINNIIVIKLSESNLETNKPILSVLRTMLHEYIHADIWRKLKTKNQKTETELSFIKTYEQFRKINLKQAQHEVMGKLYVESMAKVLKDIHKTILLGEYNYLTNNGAISLDNLYEALAWQGIGNHGVQAYVNLPQKKKDELKKAINTYYHSLTKNCPN